MRYKAVPEPADLETLAAVHRAVPLVPEGVDDCCRRVVDRTRVPGRDDAREWIAFLDALDLAERTPRGYERVRTDPDPRELGERFRRRVFGARELLSAVDEAEAGLTVEAAFDRLRPAVPEWERDRHADWEREWRRRTRRLLAWSETLGLVVEEDGRYR